MIKVRVPATSANLGPGFDTLGIAFKIYNDFYFELANEWEFIGFASSYDSLTRNIVAQSILTFYRKTGNKILPLSIKYEGNIPNKRGLGSSASCVVAGIIAANYFTGNKISKEELLKIATEIEGHPDNVAPAFYGGFTSAIINHDNPMVIKHQISKDLIFILAIPDTSLSTQNARRVLPRFQNYDKIVHNLSRVANLPYALMKGDLQLLTILLDDVLHEPYRLPLIKNASYLKRIASENNLPFCLSGSGSTVLLIAKDKTIISKLLLPNWEIKVVEVDMMGAFYE